MGSGRPIAVIEAKALGKPLDEKETMQALNYANTAGIPYMTLTNGDHWRMLEVFKQAPIKDRILMNFQLTQDEPYACALQALGLWRPNLASGEPQEAATPVMIEKLTLAESVSRVSEPSSQREITDPSNNGDWEPLTALKRTTGQQPPTHIKLPDSSTKLIKKWSEMWVSVAEYLIKTGKISAKDCPVRRKKKPEYYLLHTKPFHSTGAEFRRKKEIGKLWLNLSNVQNVPNYCCYLLEQSGVNPSTVLVSTNPS